MDKRDNEIAQAVMAIKESGAGDNAVEAVRSLVSMIPFAGGPLSNVLGEYRTRVSTKRIADTFENLHRRVIDSDVDPSKVVSEQEVVELVDGALREVVTTSDDRKLTYLRNSLGTAFTDSEIAYADKQAYFTTLRALTIAELDVLLLIYKNGDSFITREVPTARAADAPSGLLGDVTVYANEYRGGQYYANQKIELAEYYEPEDGDYLSDRLASGLSGTSEPIIRAAFSSLDGKGLTDLSKNLSRRTRKRIRLVDHDHLMKQSLGDLQAMRNTLDEVTQSTPIEGSRTEYGQLFFEFVSKS